VDVGELVLGAQAAWFRLLAERGAAHVEVDGGLAVASGLPSNTENGAVVVPGVLDRPGDLDLLLGFLRSRAVPASLLLERAVDAQHVHALTGRGLRPENAGHEMRRALTRADAAGHPPPAGVDVREVTDDVQLRDGLRVYDGDGWFEEPGELDGHHELATRVGYGPCGPVRHWVAHRESQPVGAASSFLVGDTVVLVRCCVLAAHRRLGVATSLTQARLAAAAAQGARQAVLSPSPEGARLHEALGFALVASRPDRWFYL